MRLLHAAPEKLRTTAGQVQVKKISARKGIEKRGKERTENVGKAELFILPASSFSLQDGGPGGI